MLCIFLAEVSSVAATTGDGLMECIRYVLIICEALADMELKKWAGMSYESVVKAVAE